MYFGCGSGRGGGGLQGKTSWLVGKAEEIFGGLEGEGFRGMESCVVVDVSYIC